ncbi:MAG TPA: alginate export family protein [Bryobacteraceae bacterium]|nr:alginate export family protein [Bryobacteraceae bacterium]
MGSGICPAVFGLLSLVSGLYAQSSQTASIASPVSEVNKALPSWIRFAGEFRTRFEGYTGGSFKPSATDAYTLTRLKLDLTIKPTSWLKFFGEGFDARVIGRSPALPPYQNTWDIRQAYIELGDTEKQMLGLRAGRQVINLGDQRLMGESPFSNVERTFDAIRGAFRMDGYRVDVISASVVNVVDGTWDHHQQGNDIHGLYGGIERLIPGATIEPYVFWRLQPRVKNEEGAIASVNEKVGGFRWVGTLPADFDYGVEMVREFGSLGADRIHAWAGHWVVGHTFQSAWATPRAYVEFNHASGDGNAKDGIRGTFDQLYPSGHDKYGLSDEIGWRNMSDFRTGLETRPRRNLKVNLEYNDWHLASRYDAMYNSSGTALFRSANGTAGTHIGQELDIIGTLTLFAPLQAGAGFARIFPGEFLKHVTPGQPYNFPYVMFTYTF